MQISCPSCSAVYDIPDQLVKRGPRTLRCAACGLTWSMGGEKAAAAPPPPPKAEPATPPDDAEAMVRAALAAALETAEREMRVSSGGDAAPDSPEAAAPTPADTTPAPGTPSDDKADTGRDTGTETGEETAALPTGPSGAPSRGLLIAWLATLGGLGGLILAFLLWPSGIVALWPAAAQIYDAVGLSIGAS